MFPVHNIHPQLIKHHPRPCRLLLMPMDDTYRVRVRVRGREKKGVVVMA